MNLPNQPAHESLEATIPVGLLTAGLWDGPMQRDAALLLLSVLGLGVCLWIMFRISRQKRAGAEAQAGGAGRSASGGSVRTSPARRIGDESGTVMIEFALVLPFAMFFILMIAQLMLLMTARLFVHYAAFNAARAAVVQISEDYTYQGMGGEQQNLIVMSMNSPKYRAIQEAAALSLWPVSGPGHGDIGSLGSLGDAIGHLESFYQVNGREPPAFVRNILPGRLSYALRNTEVVIHRPRGVGPSVVFDRAAMIDSFGPREAITVEVRHRFFLSMPWVGAFFADGVADVPGGGSYTMLQGHATLTNEGIITALPPRPALDRVP